MVAVAAPLLAGRPVDGGAVAAALDAMATVGSVEGRYSTATWRGHPVRLLLAKNPAGWTALFDLLDEDPVGGPPVPVVCSINARVADGHDPSWLWDVPFERLAGRPVVATGDRRLDLAVRLRYAGVPHTVAAGPAAALDRAVADGAPGADFLGNYTAFADVRRVVAP
jgi:UDP-N-acetylmuramyl tripeptide synthase